VGGVGVGGGGPVGCVPRVVDPKPGYSVRLTTACIHQYYMGCLGIHPLLVNVQCKKASTAIIQQVVEMHP
jgi:hypothetical protein